MLRVFTVLAAAAVVPLFASSALAQMPAQARLSLDRWTLSGEQPREVSGKQSASLERVLTLQVQGRYYEIDLHPAQRLLAGLPAARRLASDGTRLYRGTLRGLAQGWARVTVAGDALYVLLWDGQEFIAIEPTADRPTSKPGTGALPLQAFRPAGFESLSFLADTRAAPVAQALGSSVPAVRAAAKASAVGRGKRDVNARLQIAWIADSLFSSRHGSDAEAQMLARINVVAGIFAEQLGLELEVAELSILSVPEDPLTARAASPLLDQVEQLKLSTLARRRTAILHLFTGRDLDGSTVGIATVGAACSARYGVSLTESRRPVAVDALIAAHEIGHNLGAPHDGHGACAHVSGGFLMAPRLAATDEFSSCSLDVMADYVARAECAIAVVPSNVALSADLPSTVLVGESNTWEYLIDSASDGDALDVSLALTFPEGAIEVRSVSLEGGVCTHSDWRADCTLGRLRSGATARLRVTSLATAVGTWPIAATLSAPGDHVTQDNRVDAQVTVRPAADLTVRFEEQELVTGPGAQRRVPFTARNLGPLAARDVLLELHADSASLLAVDSAATCVQRDRGHWQCALGELAPGSDLTGYVLAQATGERSAARRETLSARIVSAFADPAPEDNEATSDLVVTEVVADLAARFLHAATALEIGERQAVELEVRNLGPDLARSVALEIALSLASVAVMEAREVDGSPCAIAQTQIRCDLRPLPAGDATTVTLVLRAVAGERLRLRSVVSGDDYDPASNNDELIRELPVSEKLVPVAVDPGASSSTAGTAVGGGGALSPLVLLLLLWCRASAMGRRVRVA